MNLYEIAAPGLGFMALFAASIRGVLLPLANVVLHHLGAASPCQYLLAVKQGYTLKIAISCWCGVVWHVSNLIHLSI